MVEKEDEGKKQEVESPKVEEKKGFIDKLRIKIFGDPIVEIGD